MRTRIVSFVLALLLLVPIVVLAQPAGARDRARAPYGFGLEHMKAEAWDEAAIAFQAATEIDPSFDLAFYMLGRTNMARKRYAEAARAYEKCRELYQAQAGRQFSNAQERTRHRDTRIREIDEVIRSYQSGPQTMQTADAIRQLQTRRRDVEEAMIRGQSTLTLEMSVPAYVSTSLGSAYFRMGRLADAEREYTAAISADAKSGEAHSNLAVVYMETGRLDAADKSVKDAEKAGFKVHPQLKEEIKNRRKAGSS